MKKLIALLICFACVCDACYAKHGIKVQNPHNKSYISVVEVPMAKAQAKAKVTTFRLVDEKGQHVAYQVTHDGMLIFEATVAPKSTAKYYFVAGTPEQAATIACGRVHPERDQDLAWENDCGGFRAYGPPLQRRGEKGFGYDLFTKRDTIYPILDDLYAGQCSGENWRKVNALKAEGKGKEAWELEQSFTYHVDHGHGMDCYAVGPTLSCGTTAIIRDGQILYPWCWDKCEVLDNGPLRFCAHLIFTPVAIGNDTVVEHRVITLDKGSNLNRTDISYEGLTQPTAIATGLVLRDDGAMSSGKQNFIAYTDPTTGKDNGKIYVGATFEQNPDSVGVAYKDNSAEAAYPGHLLAYNTYRPGDKFTYYWGFGWSKGNMHDFDTWTEYLASPRKPLKASVF